MDILPDGAVNFKAVSNTTLQATISVNDIRDLDMHRNNGVTNLL